VVNSRPLEALKLLEPAVARSPESYVLLELDGRAYAAAGRPEDGQRYLLQALAVYPDSPDACAELAVALGMRDRFAGAIEVCQKALAMDATHEKARQVLAGATRLLEQQQAELTALSQQQQANPDAVEPALRLGRALAKCGQAQEAATVLRAALARHPEEPPLATALAWLLATSWDASVRNGPEAVRLAQAACDHVGGPNAHYLLALGAAHAEAAQFGQAIDAMRQAADLAAVAGDQRLVAIIRQHLKLFEFGQAYHELP
jgi:tetratricopeptide (TPR) repeat protein